MSYKHIGRDKEDFSGESNFKVYYDLNTKLFAELQKENKYEVCC